MELLLQQFFLVHRTCHLIRDLTQIKFADHIDDRNLQLKGIPYCVTAKHFRKFVRIVTQAKKKVFLTEKLHKTRLILE